MGVIQHAIGNLLFVQRHIEEAKERLFNALSDFHESQDLINEVTVLNLIGNCYIIENKIDSAYSYYESCIELLDQLGKHQYASVLLSNIALGYSVAG
ncbi:MAG: hypothetical protein LIP08_09155, partial [Bacteroides sp.]|nr:hypothetical protein [Bacteroides sp.]